MKKTKKEIDTANQLVVHALSGIDGAKRQIEAAKTSTEALRWARELVIQAKLVVKCLEDFDAL